MSALWDALVLAVTDCWKIWTCAACRCAEGKTAVTLALVASDRGQRQTSWHWNFVSKLSSNRIKLNQAIHRCQLSRSSFSLFVNISTDVAAMRSTNNKEEDSLHWDFRTLELKRSSVCLSIFTSYLHLAYLIMSSYLLFDLLDWINWINWINWIILNLSSSIFFLRVCSILFWSCSGPNGLKLNLRRQCQAEPPPVIGFDAWTSLAAVAAGGQINPD